MKYYYYILILFFCSCSSENDIFKIKVNSDSQILNKKSNVFFEIFLNNELCKVEKLKLFINDIEVLEKTNLNGAKLGENIVKAQFNYDNQNKTIVQKINVFNDKSPILYSYEIINEFPHDISLYTQGLEFKDDILYESTGLNGFSSLRKFDLFNNKLIDIRYLDNEFFGEGLTILNDKIFQLTWKKKIGFIYDFKSLNMIKSFNYDKSLEGWGLANDGEYIYKSDGTEKIWILDPETLVELNNIEVVTDNKKVKNINELEIFENKIYANTYQSKKDVVLIIDKNSGAVDGIINFGDLRSKVKQHSELDVLNGIAYNKKRKTFFITGKKWDKIFEIRITKN
jgi:glutamine cyclotransferase